MNGSRPMSCLSKMSLAPGKELSANSSEPNINSTLIHHPIRCGSHSAVSHRAHHLLVSSLEPISRSGNPFLWRREFHSSSLPSCRRKSVWVIHGPNRSISSISQSAGILNQSLRRSEAARVLTSFASLRGSGGGIALPQPDIAKCAATVTPK